MFKLLDKKEIYKGNLTKVIESNRTEELNSKHILEVTLANEEELIPQLQKNGRILYQDKLGAWHEFIIKRIETTHDENITTYLYCENSVYELWGDYIEDKRPTNTTANLALEAVLENTRFEVGTVDNLGYNSAFLYRMSAKEALNKVAQAWGGEYSVETVVSGNEVTHRYIHLRARRGADRGKRYRYGKDILSIRRTVIDDDVITALYGYGKGEQIEDGYGRRIDFADVIWSTGAGKPLNKPAGQAYIADPAVTAQWGRPDGGEVFSKIEFDDIDDPELLLEATYLVYQQISQPKLSYECKVINLQSLDGSLHEAVALGDGVLMIDDDFQPALEIFARVLRYKEDLMDSTNDEIVLSNFIENIADRTVSTGKVIDEIRGKVGAWDNVESLITEGGINFLDGVVEALNEQMNQTAGFVYMRENVGIEVLDRAEDDNPTQSILIGGGSFRIANSKDIYGEWEYTTFGTGDGFTASLITAGILQGGKVKFDLENGTLMIGNSISDYNLLFDGQNLSLNVSHLKIGSSDVATVEDLEEIELTPGDPGTSSYLWIRYSQNANGNPMTTNPAGAVYIGIAVTEANTAPTSYSDYSWALIKGEPGAPGEPGEPGAPGDNAYVHIRYSQYADGTGFVESETNALYMGTASTNSPTAPTSKSAYKWSRIKGADGAPGEPGEPGAPGISIVDVDVMYYNSTSDTALTGGSWDTSPPAYDPDKFVWTKTVTYYSEGNPTESTPVNITANAGASGRGVESMTEQYAVSDSSTVAPTTFYDVPQAWEPGLYLWTRIKIIYTDSATPVYTTPVVDTAWESMANIVQDKADNNTVTEIAEEVSDYVSIANQNAQEIISFEQQLADYKEFIDENTRQAEEAMDEIDYLANTRIPLISTELGDMVQDWLTLTKHIIVGEEGIYIGLKDGSTAVRIDADRIDFIDGTDEDLPVATITGQLLKINRGIFVDSAQIGEHLIETKADGHTTFTWNPLP